MIPGNANPLLLATAADGAAAAGVATRSLRFNDDDSSSLSRTISSSGNLKTYTLSMWVKRSKLGYLYSMLYSTNGTNGIYYSFKNTDKLEFADYYGGSYQFQLVTSRVFRDTSAWYHIVVAVDTTQATASDRIKIYINGVQETTFDTSNYPAQNYEGSVNRASIVEYLGDMPAGDGFNGYIADVHLVDGSQLDHTSFGAFDSNNVWQAAAYSGTFGTNGFHLKFDDTSSNAALGTDSSGNDNDLTVNNLVASAPATAKGGFDVVTYTGNGSTQSISSLAFQPDLVWVKRRNSAADHQLYDSVRGANKGLSTNLTSSEWSYTGGLSSFDSTGFSVGSLGGLNGSGDTHVAWCWKAGGTAVSNTDGTITSSVSANTDYGFSIVSYTGTGANATIGHGLNATPKWIIAKTRDSAVNWIIYHASLSSDGFLRFTTAAEDNNTTVWNTAPTSSVFGVGSANGVNESGDNYIAYCWSEVPGFSKFDTYTGTGSAGLQITTGFKPRFVLIRRKAGGDWFIFDNERDSTNPVYARLYANLTNAEDTGTANGINFLDDGFSIPTTHAGLNASSAYIYAAFSAQPPGGLVDGLFDSPANGAQSDTGAGGEVSGNYAVFNALALNSNTLSNGNLDSTSGSNNKVILSTFGIPDSGKWYFELTDVDSSNGAFIGGVGALGVDVSDFLGRDANGWGYQLATNGTYYNNNTPSTAGQVNGHGSNTILGVAIDRDSNKIWFSVNNTFVNSGNPANGTNAQFSNLPSTGPLFPGASSATGKKFILNAGQRAFAYTAPSGYKALCTTNLPTPTIADPSTAMGISTWTGNGSTQQISNLNFQTDLTWIKNRGAASDHVIYNAIRGFDLVLWPGLADTEYDWGSDAITPDSTGFTINRSDDRHNASSNSYVGWSWDAGANSNKTYTVKVVSDSGNKYRFDDFGTSAVTLDLEEGSTYVFDQSDSSNSGHPLRFSTTSDGTHNSGSEYTTGVTTTGTPGSAGAKTTIVVAASAPTLYYYCSVHSGMGGQANTNSTAGASNFDGTIQAKVRANASAGFSIVEYGGTGSNDTFGHGLNAAPAFVIVKKYNGSDNWHLYHESAGNTKFLKLNATTAATTKASAWNSTSPTSSVVSLGSDGGVNSGARDFIAFCFAPVDQFSSFGTYSGNGNANGPFVALSFRPAFLLLKRTDSTSNWLIYDYKREGYNFNNDPLYANLSATEGTTDYLDLLSNGFKIRNTHSSINASGGTYIYVAFSENAFSLNGGLAR